MATIQTLFTSAAMAKQPPMRQLANEGDFVVLSDVQSSAQSLFLSYVGKEFNHCGIKIRLSSSPGQMPMTEDLLVIRNKNSENLSDVGVIKNGVLMAEENSESLSYGTFYSIETRSGKTLAAAIKSLSPGEKVDAIVEILPCRGT